MQGIITPIIPDEFVSFAQAKVRNAIDRALEMTAAELLVRGEFDDEGEPRIGIYPYWIFDDAAFKKDGNLIIDDLRIRLAEVGEKKQPSFFIYPFRETDRNNDRIVAQMISHLHFEMTCRLSNDRPLKERSDQKLKDLKSGKPRITTMQQKPNHDELLERRTLARLAALEQQQREKSKFDQEPR